MNWISAAEKMPPVGEWLIVSGKKASNFDPIVCEASFFGMLGHTRDRCFVVVDITHWMPMPAAPEAEKPAEPAREWRCAWNVLGHDIGLGTFDDREIAARLVLTHQHLKQVRVQSRTSATASQSAGEWQDEQ